MNENSLFFFHCRKKKYSFEIEWMNELWTFTGKKKHKKNTQIYGKKKHTPLSKKIKKNPPDPEWTAHELFLGKNKVHPCIFFSASRKKTQFYDLNEWMAHELCQENKIEIMAKFLMKRIFLYSSTKGILSFSW